MPGAAVAGVRSAVSAGLAQPLPEAGCPRQREPRGRGRDTLRTVRYSPEPERFVVEPSGDQVMSCWGYGTRRTLALAETRRCPWNSFTKLTFPPV